MNDMDMNDYRQSRTLDLIEILTNDLDFAIMTFQTEEERFQKLTGPILPKAVEASCNFSALVVMRALYEVLAQYRFVIGQQQVGFDLEQTVDDFPF